MPCGPSSSAKTLDIVSSAAFDAEYAAPSGRGLRTEPVVMLTMHAPSAPRATQWRPKACDVANAPVTFTSKTRRHSATGISSTPASG